MKQLAILLVTTTAAFALCSTPALGRDPQAVDRILAKPAFGRVHRELAAWIAFQQAFTISATAAETAALARRVLSEVALDDLVNEGQTVEFVVGALLTHPWVAVMPSTLPDPQSPTA